MKEMVLKPITHFYLFLSMFFFYTNSADLDTKISRFRHKNILYKTRFLYYNLFLSMFFFYTNSAELDRKIY